MFYKFMHIDVSGVKKPREERPGACYDMHADACILEQSPLEMTVNCVYECEPLAPVESREDARPSSKNIRSIKALNATSVPTFSGLLYNASAPYFTLLQMHFPPFIQIVCQTKFLK